MNDLIQVTLDGAVALIRLNRPKQLNALNAALAAEMVQAVQSIDADPAIGCMVITGNDRAFAAGADIAEMAQMTAQQMGALDFFGEWGGFANTRKPKIAAVHGYALGGGCEVMMMCDFAIAGARAKFGQPEVTLGVMAGMGGTQRMTKLIGRARAMDLHLTGRMMDATEALQAGLIARVVPDDQVLPQALAAAQLIAGYSRPAVRLIRESIARAEHGGLAEGLLFERRVFHGLFGSPDQREGMAAFLAKRPAVFTQP